MSLPGGTRGPPARICVRKSSASRSSTLYFNVPATGLDVPAEFLAQVSPLGWNTST